TPIICPAQPPSILSRKTPREISRIPLESRPVMGIRKTSGRKTSARRITDMVGQARAGVQRPGRRELRFAKIPQRRSQLGKREVVARGFRCLRQHALAGQHHLRHLPEKKSESHSRYRENGGTVQR